jgi:hypothetical protein
MKWLATYTFLLLLLQSCFREDEKVKPFPGEITTITDSVQTYQSYFDFESGAIISVNPLNDWQLGFECGTNGWHIITNSGADWFIYNTGLTTTNNSLQMPVSLSGLYDTQGMWPEGTAAGNWVEFSSEGKVYTNNIYMLGRYTDGVFKQVKQIIFRQVTDSSYLFQYEDNSVTDSVLVSKKNDYNFVYYNFINRQQVEPEPMKTRYDIVFTSYFDLATLFGQTIPYHVGGVLMNVWNTMAVVDSSLNYAGITIETVAGLNFTNRHDIPGYRWKQVSVDITGGGTATYDVKTGYNYIFKTAQGNYFKMRFLSYTLDGRSGFPRFEYLRLE